MDTNEIIQEAKRVFNIEINALESTRDVLGKDFVEILNLITGCRGKVIVTGVGKPGHIATKIVATLSSLGTPAFYLHPAEALHGDLGSLSSNDVVIAISYSGESGEIVQILSGVKLIGAKLIAITGKRESTLAKEADIVQVLPKFNEACRFGLAPTSSTTVELCYGDALAVVASEKYGFTSENFGRIHPAGVLGKKLRIRVEDLMAEGDENAVLSCSATLKDVIIELSKKKLGMVNILDDNGSFAGIITGGDVYRVLEEEPNIYSEGVKRFIKQKPFIIGPDELAVNALDVMRKNNIINLPVISNGILKGTIIMQEILKAGII